MLLFMRQRLEVTGARLSLAAALALLLVACSDERRPAAYPSDGYVAQQPVEGSAVVAESDGEPADYPEAEQAYSPSDDGEAAGASSTPVDYDPAVDQDPSAVTDFQPVLAPYGAWVDDATYGTVWVPSESVVGADFAPYVTAGHWAMTERDDWIWVSDYDWGWAPFHYGRWVWIGGRGWSWIPGRVYAPAWVVWRTGYYDDYYVGWAPMPPTWYWSGGLAVSLWAVPPAPYVFCSTRYVFMPGIHTHVVPASRVSVVATHTRPYVAAAPGSRPGYASYVRGPSRVDAHLPAQPVPRAAPDSRALSFAKPVAGARIGASSPPISAQPVRPRTIGAQPSTGAPVYGRSPARPAPVPAPAAGVRPAPSAIPRGAPTVRPTPAPRPVSPTYRPAPRPSPAPTYRPAPSPSYRPSPSYSPAPSFRPAPSPAPRYTPSPSFRPSPAPAPAFRPSPSYQPSPGRVAPTSRGGGGGRHR